MTEFVTVATFDNSKDAYAYLCKRVGYGQALIDEGFCGTVNKHQASIEESGTFFLSASGDGHGNYRVDTAKVGHIIRVDDVWNVNLPAPKREPEWVICNLFMNVDTKEPISSALYKVYDFAGPSGSFYIDQYDRKFPDVLSFDKDNFRYRIENGEIIVEKKQ